MRPASLVSGVKAIAPQLVRSLMMSHALPPPYMHFPALASSAASYCALGTCTTQLLVLCMQPAAVLHGMPKHCSVS